MSVFPANGQMHIYHQTKFSLPYNELWFANACAGHGDVDISRYTTDKRQAPGKVGTS